MCAESPNSVLRTFKFSFPTCTNEEILFKLEVPVEIPHNGSTRELVQRVLNMFHIPVYLEDELNEKLAAFVAEETKCFHNERDSKLLDQLKNGELNVDGVVKGWEKLFKENVVEFAEQTGTSDEEVFAGAYHKLVHSAALDAILQVEAAYAKTVRATLAQRDQDISRLTQRQTAEMEEKVRLVNMESGTTEAEVNALAGAQFEAQALVSGRWGSQLDALRHAQRAQHRAALMATLLDYHHTNALHTPRRVESRRTSDPPCWQSDVPLVLWFTSSPLNSFPESADGLPGPGPPATAAATRSDAAPRLEDSFTIHLGSQLKQTHNIRIAAMDLLDLCFIEGDMDTPTCTSRRLQTSLGLYGSELAAVVILTETPPDRPPPPGSAAARLLEAAAASTEFHFLPLDAQLRNIADCIKEPLEKRNASRASEPASGASVPSGPAPRRKHAHSATAGDVFVSTHSNLADVHVVFHLMVDDSLKSGDITSRHPAILGLRNILKVASNNDITSIALPLLLRHEHSEEMTAAWCLRRAELVLKCVKGFVLEGAGGGGAELRTLTFAAPTDTATALFMQLAALPPHIFRLSNPVKYRPAPPDC